MISVHYISRIWGDEPPERIEPNFLAVEVCDEITWLKLGDDRLRGLGSAEGQSLPFPIDFDDRPYNTLTLPCERVMHNRQMVDGCTCEVKVVDMVI